MIYDLTYIIYEYDGFPIQPVPQDEDEREPRFIQAHDPDFVPEPVYPEYIPLEDEHVILAEEQPLPPDGPVDYPMGEGDDWADDDGDSFRDDAADEDEDMEEEEEDDEEEEEEEEHIASADSIAIIPVVELVSSPEGTKPVLPPPSINIITTGARISVRLQASVSLPSTVDVERLLALPTQPLSPLTSLSPPFAGECLARLTDPSVHPSPLLLPSSRYPAEAVPAIAPTTVEEVNTRVVELAELHEHDIQDFYALLEDAQDGRSRISQRVYKNSQQVDLLMGDRMTLQETTAMEKLRETDRERQVQLIETLRVVRDM
nr:hypothetical protein [Tanacetum cinerariifolium]